MSEGLDFDALRTAPSTTPDDERTRCPECGSTQTRRNTGKARGPRATSEYACDACRAKFDASPD